MPPYRIMTFDGGGVKGSLMATLVKRISDRYPNLLEQVDLYAGTSTGSVVALTLASGFSADKLVDFYSQENLRSAFSPSRFNWFRPKYSNINFRSLHNFTQELLIVWARYSSENPRLLEGVVKLLQRCGVEPRSIISTHLATPHCLSRTLAKQYDQFLTNCYGVRSKKCCSANHWDVKSQIVR